MSVDPQILLESTNQWKSSVASRDAAKATITKAEAQLLSKQATFAKATVDVSVARADLAVATSEAKRIEAWVGYLTLTAPFDGVIVARNANTFDFVLPSMGDPSADTRAPHLSPSGGAAPIYVVDRTDVVRIFVDIPEQDANFVQVGTKATCWSGRTATSRSRARSPAPRGPSMSRAARSAAEIDLPNPGGQLLPGMYAYANVLSSAPACGRYRSTR